MPEERPSALREVVTLDAKVYDLECVKRAAYRFIDRCSADISVIGEEINCAFQFSASTPNEVTRLVDDFRKEVLDQDLRKTIARETAPLRNAILALAFSASSLQGNE